jgi:hypothetical protein
MSEVPLWYSADLQSERASTIKIVDLGDHDGALLRDAGGSKLKT